MNRTDSGGAAVATPRGRLGQINDLGLVVALAGLVGLIVLPLPTVLLDALIALNITIGLTLMLMAIYISSAIELSVFPSLLLLTTVFRLSLSIAATRMILTEAQAGRIIDTFGAMAAGGNLVVGLVVFLIITVVQFVVIAKGAERVAEVSARFSLDSMPGKQLSIDSDLRSGLIEKEEARRRRRLLELESKLHGSLDGAMKFVKGDAVAGLIIVAVNLIGGLLIGMLQRGLPLADAVRTYSVLTIGDGMVTQIPALLITMAAGLIVTRATDEAKDESLVSAIRFQLSTRPKVPILVGVLCWVVAFVPGFPWQVFLLLGCASVGTGLLLDPNLLRSIGLRLEPTARLLGRPPLQISLASTAARPQLAHNVALRLELPAVGFDVAEGDRLRAALEDLLGEFEIERGIALPAIVSDASGPPDSMTWRLVAYDLPIGGGVLDRHAFPEDVRRGVKAALRRHIGAFVGIQETSAMLARVGLSHPEVVKELGRVRSLAKTAEVLRRLAVEEVPLCSLHVALEALVATDPAEKDSVALAEIVRIALREHTLQRYVTDGRLRAVVLAGPTEALLREALQGSGATQRLALAPKLARQLILDIGSKTTDATALVVNLDLRRHIRRLIEPEHFDVPVLSFNELYPALKLDIVGAIEVAAAPAVAA